MNINFYWALIFWNAHFSLAICHRFHRHCQVDGLAISAAPIVQWIGLKCLGFGDMYCMCSFSHVQRWHSQAGGPILFLWLQEITALASQKQVRLHVDLCLGGFVLPFGFDSLPPADALPDSFHNQLWSGHAPADGSALRNKKVAKGWTLSYSEEGKSSVRFERLL